MAPIPDCRWRGTHANGNATCSSSRILSSKHGFDAAKICATCAIVDHAPLTDEEIAKRAALREMMRQPAPQGPGTELKAMLAEWGITPDNCQCEAWVAKMNRWGIAGCQEHRMEIAERLREMAVATVKEFPVTDPAEAFLPLVDEAIRRAESGIG